MDWTKFVNALGGQPNSALVLLWAIGRARFDEPRRASWPDVREELTSLFSRYGAEDPSDAAFAGLQATPIWEVSGQEGGLPTDVYDAVGRDADERKQAVDALIGTFPAGVNTVLLLTELGLTSSWDGYGPVPGVRPGQPYLRRVDAARAKVHRPLQAGICGTKELGCESIAIVGGYEDDVDNVDVIIYTGEGGRDRDTGRQIRDQTLTRGNASLITSKSEGKPVRVLRGSTATGYTYGGLFVVEDYWQTTGKAGFLIWQYKLVAVDSLPSTAPLVPAGNPTPGRRRSAAERLLRSLVVAHWVKKVNNFTCQFCHKRYDSPVGPYAETAHIRPLGGRHEGPDLVENALCLCPTHHKLFDLGAFVIDDNRMVIDVMARQPLGELREVAPHRIDLQYAEYHRELRPVV